MRTIFLLAIRVVLGLVVASLAPNQAVGQAGVDEAQLATRSLLQPGDTVRLQRVLHKARRGDPVTVAVIGGSITQGASASRPEFRYGNRVAKWWQATFPSSKVEFVNAGIGATGSNYGALRAQRDLLSKNPDFVVVEYAVNDGNVPASAATLEGLLRQILKRPNEPAVVLLFMMNKAGGNAQEWFVKVGEHYRLPMVSYRDALWPEIQAGRMQWSDISPDTVHPNDRGHAYTAQWVIRLLEQVWREMPSAGELPKAAALPKPKFSDLFEHTALLEADALKPTVNNGWSYNPKTRAWTSDKPGSVFEAEISGRLIFSMHYVVRGPMGQAQVSVDGVAAKKLDGWFNQTWGGYRQTNEVARDLPPGKHRVRIELLGERNADSTGREFRILGLGAAGVQP